MRTATAVLLMTMTMMEVACGGSSSPLGPTRAAGDHVEPPGVLSVAGAADPIDCTPALSPESGTQTARADQRAAWTMTVTFPAAPAERRGECRWRMDSVDRDLIIADPVTGTTSDGTPAQHGDGQVQIQIDPQQPSSGATQVRSLRMLRLTGAGSERPVLWNFTQYRWQTP